MAASLEAPDGLNPLLGAIPQELRQGVFSRLGLKDRHGTKLTLDLTVDFLAAAALRPNLGSTTVLEELIAIRGAPPNWGKEYLPHSSQITEARDRAGWKAIRELFRDHATWVDASTSRSRWKGLRVGAIDGSTLRAEDSAENESAFGRPAGRNGPGGFPVLRALALVDVQTHHVQAATFGRYNGKGSGETSLLRDSLLGQVPADWLSLLDRGFCCYGTMRDYCQANRKFMGRMKRSGTWIRPRKRETLRAGLDWLVELPVPASFNRHDDARPLQLRMMRWSIPKRRSKRSNLGSLRTKRARAQRAKAKKEQVKASRTKTKKTTTSKRPRQLWLLTNLTDVRKYPYEELAPLYLRRWEVEFVFREIKTTLTSRKVEFRTKKPERVLQEAYALLLTYNAIRLRMAQAAKIARVEPRQLSFKDCLEASRRAYFHGDPVRLLLRRLTRYVLKARPPRSYPRAVKARSTRFPTKASANAA
ncbi:MAG: IS4 family transposase [Actinomycetota bacterium]